MIKIDLWCRNCNETEFFKIWSQEKLDMVNISPATVEAECLPDTTELQCATCDRWSTINHLCIRGDLGYSRIEDQSIPVDKLIELLIGD